MEKERLIIKNFGPIVEADIEIKPFMVFIGESGSGKSVVLKTLALCRWIHKKVNFASVVNYIESTDRDRNVKNTYKKFYKEEIKEIKIDTLMNHSGLDDYLNAEGKSEIEYQINNFRISITNKDNKIAFNTPKDDFIVLKENITLEKITFISDDRFAIPILLGGLQAGQIPYYLKETYNNFTSAFAMLSKDSMVKMNTLGFQIVQEKKKDTTNFFIEKDGYKVHFENASSGMKSIANIEIITKFYIQHYDIFKSLQNFLILNASSFGVNFLLDIALNIKKENEQQKSNYKNKISLFIEEPELSLFPNAQKSLIEYLVSLFNQTKNKEVNMAFSTHSPYILSALNCLLKAHKISIKKPDSKQGIKKILDEKYWLNIDNFNAFKVKDGNVKSIINKKTNLILADEIDKVSEEIGEIFDDLLDLEYE
ncbi:AAA family ATPase [Helicobacter japonicus]|uniref:AAA family ATPase n=1 Tax=Helicobacter japonicus TaxID=425400 RepID=UPI0023F2F9C5|nr:AAA family ATPase [Helicobacter japonicus]